jgi:hypothetical protein
MRPAELRSIVWLGGQQFFASPEETKRRFFHTPVASEKQTIGSNPQQRTASRLAVSLSELEMSSLEPVLQW